MPKYQKIHREPTNKRPEEEEEIIKLDSGFVILTVEIGIHTLVVVIIPMLAMVVEIAITLLNQQDYRHNSRLTNKKQEFISSDDRWLEW